MVKTILLLSLLGADITAIRDVRLFDGEQITQRATVVFRDGVITSVETAGTLPEGATVIDGKGKTLLPGFIDSHTHTWGDALVRALRFGVTTELDMFSHPDFGREMRKQATDRADFRSAGILITVKGGHGSQYFPIPLFTPGSDAQAFVDARLAEGSDYIKLIYEGGEAYGRTRPTLTRDDLGKLIAAVKKRGKLAVVHISTQQRANEALEAGADGLVHVFGTSPSPGFGAMAAKRRAFVVPTLSVQESVSGTPSGIPLIDDPRLAPFLNASEMAGLKQSFPKFEGAGAELTNASAAVAQLREAGVPLLAGSDAPNPGTAHGVTMHRELELLVKAGLTPSEALAAATSVPARVFGLSDRGRVAKGKRADLVLVNGDPTSDITATRDIAAIWKSGVPVERKPEKREELPPAERPAAEKLTSVLSDFESGSPSSAFGSGWLVSTDSIFGGKSVATIEIVEAGNGRDGRALRVKSETKEGAPYPWAGAVLWFGSPPMTPVDLSGTKGIALHVRGDAIQVMVFSRSGGPIPRVKNLAASAEWSERVVTWSELGIDPKDVQGVLLAGGPAGASEFLVEDVRLR
jgi:imidazolonepropionase-like amidohydrolase